MKLKNLFIFDAVAALLFGLAFVFVPDTVASTYGATLNDIAKYLSQLLGAAFIAIGIISWYVRDTPRSETRDAIVLAHMIGDGAGLVIAALAQLAGVLNDLGWSIVVIYAILTIGFAYFHFSDGDN